MATHGVTSVRRLADSLSGTGWEETMNPNDFGNLKGALAEFEESMGNLSEVFHLKCNIKQVSLYGISNHKLLLHYVLCMHDNLL